MDRRRVSVIIPVFNGERFLGEAISSALDQGETPLEVIVVDDGSTDAGPTIAEGFGHPVTVVRQANSGPAAARNAGLGVARGEYIAFLDADDLYSPDTLGLQAGRLDRHPEIDIVIGQRSNLRAAQAEGSYLSLVFGCAMIRRAVFDRIGTLDESLRIAEDWDWFMRAREAGVPLLLHRHVVLQYRTHSANMTGDREATAQFAVEMMRRSLARRRRGQAAVESLPPLSEFFEPDEES